MCGSDLISVINDSLDVNFEAKSNAIIGESPGAVRVAASTGARFIRASFPNLCILASFFTTTNWLLCSLLTGDDDFLTEAHSLSFTDEGLGGFGGLVDEHDGRSHLETTRHLALAELDCAFNIHLLFLLDQLARLLSLALCRFQIVRQGSTHVAPVGLISVVGVSRAREVGDDIGVKVKDDGADVKSSHK